MKRSIVAFAVLGSSTAFAFAQSTIAGYGTPEGGTVRQTACEGCPPGAGGGATPVTPVEVHGSQALGNNTSLVFTVESDGLDDNTRAGQDGRRARRQAYAGLANGFGAFTVGRQYSLDYLALADVGDPFQGDTAGSASNLIGNPDIGASHSIQFQSARVRGVTAGASYGGDGIDGSVANRAWGMSVGVEAGPLTLRVAHQNRQVARIHLYDLAGNNMEAKNSIIAANVKLGWGTAYAAYSASSGWGSSPLFNPDNPYGAGLASTPSTDSRDVLVGVAVPCGRYTTLLASFIHKNDRDLANRDANQLAIGASYTMSRSTDFYAAWSHIQNTNGAGYTLGNWSGQGNVTSALNIGMRHAF
jgi:predicted porin